MGNCFGRHDLTEAELRQIIRVIDPTDLAYAGENNNINKSGSKTASRPNDEMFDDPPSKLAASFTPDDDDYNQDGNDGDGDDSDSVELKLAFSTY